MPEIQALTKDQIDAIALLAAGTSQGVTAKRLGVTRATVNRWCNKIPEFATELQAEIDRRQQRAKEQYQAAADEVQDEAIAQFKEDLRRFQSSLRSAYQARIGHGLKIVQKVGRRFDDLPDEAIGVNNMAPLLTAGDNLIEKGFKGWAESLSITELMQRLDSGEI